MQGFFQTAPMRIMASLVFLMVIIALGSYATLNFEQVKYANPNPATITVNGEGEVLAVPDIGRFSFSVRAEAAEAAAAQEASATKINDVIAYLKGAGVDEKDIKTESYYLTPKYRWEQEGCVGDRYCPGKEVQDGFIVSQMVQVKVRKVDTAGTLIAGVGERGATDISSLEFTIDDIDLLRDEARTKAIADAQEKAGVLARQLGVRVARLVSYYESNEGVTPYYAKTFAVAEDAAAMGVPDLPVGEESTKVQVSVTYEVR